jgi:hypothetical protein
MPGVLVSHLVLVVSKAFKADRMGAVKGLLVGYLMAARGHISIAGRTSDMLALTFAPSSLQKIYRNICNQKW